MDFRTGKSTMTGTKRAIVALSAVGLMVLLLNMFGNSPTSVVSYTRLSDESQLEESGFDVNLRRKMDAKLWGKPGPLLEPCWSEHLPKRSPKTWGFVVVTTSKGPQNHRAQIADAVVVAVLLGASLVVPNVKEALNEPNSRFEDIYNVKNFISSLDGVVRVVGRLPKDMEKINGTFTSIPLRVSHEHIDEAIRPVFNQQGGLVLLSSFLSAMKGGKEDLEMTALRCLVMYKALQFVPLIQKLGDRLINRVREAAPESSGKRFVAVDLRLDLLQHKMCNVTDVSRKTCIEPQEVGQFLKRLGYPSETAIYLTQSRWNPKLESLRETFPNVHTKEYTMPFNEENQYLFSGKTQFEQAVDFYVCSRSDVFVPTIPGVFYSHVVGERILAGLNHIILPTSRSVPGSSEFQFIGVSSPYVEKRSHRVYRCYCEPSLQTPVNKSRQGIATPNWTSQLVSGEKDSSKELPLQ